MTAARAAKFAPLLFVPLVAWSKDATVVVLFAAALAFLVSRDGRRAVLAPPPAHGLFGILTIFWALISLAWSPAGGAILWLQVVLVLAAASVVIRGLGALDAQVLRALTVTFVAAVGALFAVLAIERATGAALIGLHRAGEPTARLYDVLSAGLAFLCCMAFPAAFRLSRLARRPAVGATFVAFVFGVAVSYNMDAAPVAIGLGAIAFAATYLGGPHVLTGTLIAGAALALSWGVLAEAAMARGAGGWLDATFGANWSLRLGYWARIQELIGHAPVAGHGFGAGRVLGRSGEFDGPVPVPFMHPHNGVLEIWLDLGLIGVALVAAWAATGARRVLGTVPDRAVLATIGATIATTSVFVLVSFSIWLGWWLSALGLIAAALVLVNRVAARAEI